MYAYPTHQNIAVIHSTVSFIIGKRFYSICSSLSKGEREREREQQQQQSRNLSETLSLKHDFFSSRCGNKWKEIEESYRDVIAELTCGKIGGQA